MSWALFATLFSLMGCGAFPHGHPPNWRILGKSNWQHTLGSWLIHYQLMDRLESIKGGVRGAVSYERRNMSKRVHTRTASVRNVIRIKWHNMSKHVMTPRRIPNLSPIEFQVFPLGQFLLDSIMYPLYKHSLEFIFMQNSSHGGTVSKGIDTPMVDRYSGCIEVGSYPVMSFL